jgi:hypothetical protein
MPISFKIIKSLIFLDGGDFQNGDQFRFVIFYSIFQFIDKLSYRSYTTLQHVWLKCVFYPAAIFKISGTANTEDIN